MFSQDLFDVHTKQLLREPLGTCKSGFLKTLFLCLEYFSEVIYNKKSNYSDSTVKGTEQLREKYNRDMGANMKNCKRIVFICLLFLSLTSLLLVPARTEAATQNSAEATVKKAAGKWISKNGKLRYRYANKKYAKSGFTKIHGSWYCFDKNGKLQTGWKTIGSKRFYFEKKGEPGEKGKLVTGWKKIGKKEYYFRKSGKKGTIGATYKSEWKTLNKQDYYFDKNGAWYQKVPTNEDFIATIAPMAVRDMKKTGILASVTMAQAIHESVYGTSSLALEGKNLFGIKAGGWGGKTFSKKTQEYIGGKWYTVTAKFRAYSSYQKSISDHSSYLNTAMNGSRLRYQGLKGCKNYKKAFQIIKDGGYATDPKYVSKLCKIVKKYNLTKYDKM